MVPTTDAQFKTVWDVSADGRTLVFGQLGDTNSWDLWILPLEEGGKPKVYQAGPGQEQQARLSPDGKWLAYASNGSGRQEVYAQSFPVPGRKVRISVDGGGEPTWTRGGKELLYGKDDTILSVPIAAGTDLEPGAPHPLLTVPEGTTGGDITADGERLLVTAGPDVQRDIRVILNWTALLKH